MLHFQTSVFPTECKVAHIRPIDLNDFNSIGLDRINGGSHLAQLRSGPQTVGLASLNVYPEHEEVFLTFIEISSAFRGDKLGRRLLSAVFDYTANISEDIGKHMFVTVGGFTEKGKRSILPAMRELSIDYSQRGVTFDCPQMYRDCNLKAG